MPVTGCTTDLRQLRPPLLDAVFNPGHDSVEHLLFAAHVELVARNDVDQLIGWEQHELFTLHYLRKEWQEEEKTDRKSVHQATTIPPPCPSQNWD